MQLLEGAECEYNLLKYNELWPHKSACRTGWRAQPRRKRRAGIWLIASKALPGIECDFDG